MTAEPIIYVVDDDEASQQLLHGLMTSVDMEVESYAAAREFLDSYRPGRPSCLLLDVRMPGMSGLELQEELKARQINVPVIFITGHGDTRAAVRAMKAGAFDFIEKPINNQEVLELVQKAVDRSKVDAEERVRSEKIRSRFDLLTQRENDVLERIVTGKLNKQIAIELGISERTVEVHRAGVMEKMDAESLADLMKQVIGTEPYTGKP